MSPTPHAALSCPWVMNFESWINSMIFTKDWAPPVFWIRCLCALQTLVLMWGHVHADIVWSPRTHVLDPLKLGLGFYGHYFLLPATGLYYMALLKIKVHQEMLGKLWKEKIGAALAVSSNSLSLFLSLRHQEVLTWGCFTAIICHLEISAGTRCKASPNWC